MLILLTGKLLRPMSRKINIWANLDWITVLVYLVMLIIGWISIYSAVYDDAHQSIFDTSQRYGKQLVWIIAAIVIAAAVLMTDNKLFLFFSYFFYGFTILLLIAVLFFGIEVNASKSWFQFGVCRFSLQNLPNLPRHWLSHNF
jgi:rod shape determining protein RodA